MLLEMRQRQAESTGCDNPALDVGQRRRLTPEDDIGQDRIPADDWHHEQGPEQDDDQAFRRRRGLVYRHLFRQNVRRQGICEADESQARNSFSPVQVVVAEVMPHEGMPRPLRPQQDILSIVVLDQYATIYAKM